MDLKGKRLLILGATSYIINVVKIAKSMGVYTIVTDPVKDNAAKKYADKAYDVNTKDIDALMKIALDEKVDGIMTAYSDLNLPVCRELCDRLGFPFYASTKNIEQTVDKIKFKEMCRKYNVPVVPEYTENDIDDIEYPVIVKPSDSYGSKGITVCRNREQLLSGIEFAKEYSPTKQVIIEEYMVCDDVNIDYAMQDGEVVFTAMGDRYVNKDQKGKSPLSLAVIYPSKYIDRYLKEVDANAKRMFKDEGFRDGMVFIQSFMSNKGFHFFEMGYRPGGGQSSILLKKINDIDYVEYLINYALTGKMSDDSIAKKNNIYFDKHACGLVVLLKQGVISSIRGLDEIKAMPEVLNITQFYEEGEEVPPSCIGNLGQSFARIHIVTETREELKNIIDKVQNALIITDSEGNDMKLSGLDTSVLNSD